MTGKSSWFAQSILFSDKKYPDATSYFHLWLPPPPMTTSVFDSISYLTWVVIMTIQKQPQKTVSAIKVELIKSGMCYSFWKALTLTNTVLLLIQRHEKSTFQNLRFPKHFCYVEGTKPYPNKGRREIVFTSPCTLNKCLTYWPQNHPSGLQ